MPTVPFAGETLVKPQPLPGVRQPSGPGPAAFGAAGGRALEKVAGDIQQVGRAAGAYAEAQERDDIRNAHRAWTMAQADVDLAVQDARARKGPDVAPPGKPGLTETFNDTLDKIKAKHTQGLSPQALERFSLAWEPFAEVRWGEVSAHQNQQLDRMSLEDSAASVERTLQRWAANPLDPAVVLNANEELRNQALFAGRIKGDTPERSEEEFKATRTKGHLNAIAALRAADRPGEAMKYFEQYKEGIDPRVRAEVEERLKDHTETALSQAVADDLWAKSGGDITKALDDARKAHSGSMEEKIVHQLRARDSEAELGKRRREDAAYNLALDKVIRAESHVDAVESAMKADVTPEVRLRLLQVANGLQRAERGEGGNPAGLVDIMEKIDREELKTPLAVQAAAGEMKLSKTEIRQAVQYQQQGGIAGEVKASKIASLVKGWKKDVTGEELGDIVKFVAEDLKKQAPGKPVTDEELSQRVAGYLWKGETTARVRAKGNPEEPWNAWGLFGAGWNESALKARRAGNIESWIPDISSDEETALRAELSDITGISPDKFDETTLRIFKKQKAGLPLGTKQKTKVPEAKPKAAPTPSSEITTRQRSKAMEAAAALDNSGTD